ncbi:VRR-NUC domain-containing protein [bacterium]|nr:VRR-NUC domain-containing protein [bacterium]
MGIALCGERWRLPTTGLGSFPAGGNARQATAPCQTEVDFVKPPLPPKLKSILVPLHNRKRDSKVVISMPQDCTAVNIVRQKDNPMDPRALLCTCLSAASAKILDFDEPTNVLGYLPRQVSTHLSPLIDEDLIFLTATLRYRRTDTAILEEGASMDSVLELCATICSTKEVLQEEQHMLVASAWSAATKASEDARIGLQEVIRLRFWSAVGRIRSSAHSHLLDTVEVRILETLHKCSLPAQRLAFRLLQRKTTWFRISSLQYSDVPNVESAVDELQENGLVLSADNREVDENMEARLTALKSDELIMLSKLLGLDHRQTKAKLIAMILSSTKTSNGDHRLFHNWLSIFNGRSGMIRLCTVSLRAVQIVNFLTFLRPTCGLQSLVLEDVGVIRYPPHGGSLERASSIFTSRVDLDEYLNVIAEASVIDATLDAGDEKTALKILETRIFPWVNGCARATPSKSSKHHSFLRRFEPDWVRAKMATIGITLLERNGRHADANLLLTRLLSCRICPERRGTWYLRLIINLNTVGHLKNAMQACDRALQDPWVRCGDRLGIQWRALRLAKKVKSWGTLGARWRSDITWEAPIDSIRARALNGAEREKKRYCTFSEVGEATVSVEELAITHYAEEDAGGWRGVHSESRVWMTLFGLLFADVIMSPVPGVFHGPFQSAPLDFGTDSFVEARREDITSLLSRIRRGEGTKIVRDVWRRYYGTAIHGVSWILLSLDELCDVINGLGGVPLAEVMGLIVEDTSGWTGGAPDLLLWRQSSVGPKVKAVEVKSKNDQLSDQQRAWLLALRDAGVPAAVCRVSF